MSTSMQYFLDKLNTFIPASSGYSQTYCISMLEAVVERLALISDLSNYSYYFQAPDFSTEESMKDARKLFGT